MDFTPTDLPWNAFYKLMIGSIVPRPIGWVSTIDDAGHHNLAPFSFFNAVCANPPHVLFCPMIRTADGAQKDTLRNVRSTGEFVVNIVTVDLIHAMNLTSTELPADVDEFALAGITPLPAMRVRPMRVAESPVHYECTVTQIVDIGDAPGSGSIVIGRVLHLHVNDEVLLGSDKIDIARLNPIGRLAGSDYAWVTDTISLNRPPSKIATGG
ncbi:MAG: flavin reductase family protein [Chloroflexi bacterium]|nr:flavin reductase family protein [Chloroflexota bacterium]